MILRNHIFSTLEYLMPQKIIHTKVKSTIQDWCFNNLNGSDRVETALQKTVVSELAFDTATIDKVKTML